MYTGFLGNFIHIAKTQKQPKISINNWMDKQIVIYLHNGLFSNEQKWTFDIQQHRWISGTLFWRKDAKHKNIHTVWFLLKTWYVFECLLIYSLLLLHPSLKKTRPFEWQFPTVGFADPIHSSIQHDPHISCKLEARSRGLGRLRLDVFGIKGWHVFSSIDT